MLSSKNTKSVYYIALIFVVLIWGLFPVVSKYLLNFYSAALWNATSSLICAISMLILCSKKLRHLNWNYFKIAVSTGLFFSAANVVQKLGLGITSPAMYAFLENTSCIFVPVLMLIFVKEKLTLPKVLSGLLCLVGVFILCGGIHGLQFGPGEILCALAGIFYSINIAGTAAYGKKLDVSLFLLVQFIVHAIVSWACVFLYNETRMFSFQIGHLTLLVLSVLISTVLGWLVRTECLKHLDAAFVSVAMPFTAVVTGIASVLVGTDTLSASLVVGALLILAAIFISGLADTKQK